MPFVREARTVPDDPTSTDRVLDVQASSHAVDFDVSVVLGPDDDPARLDEVQAVLPPGWTTRPGGVAASRFELRSLGAQGSIRGPEVDDTLPWDDAVHALDAGIRAVVSLHAPHRVFIHAGVVAGPAGALVIPGRSFAGKTTLVAALLRAGATYYSDEYAVLDAEGRVHPYPRRLSVRGPAGERSEVPAHEVVGSGEVAVGSGPIRVAGVAALSYEEGASWPPPSGEPAGAAMALIDNAVAARSRSADVLATAAAVARGAWFLTGPRGDADEAAAGLLARLSAGS